MSPPGSGRRAYRGKRAFDCILALVGVVVTTPVFVIAAVAVRLSSSGPVLYRGRRVGLSGHEFDVLKFRSMRVGTTGSAITAAGDVRVTGVGRVLRRFKIDELPQLWNVLAGDMSIVGPRPEDARYVANYTDAQRQILQWRPGITSPASIRFRHEEHILAAADDRIAAYEQISADKISIDMAYLERASLVTDARVVLATFAAVLSANTRR